MPGFIFTIYIVVIIGEYGGYDAREIVAIMRNKVVIIRGICIVIPYKNIVVIIREYIGYRIGIYWLSYEEYIGYHVGIWWLSYEEYVGIIRGIISSYHTGYMWLLYKGYLVDKICVLMCP